MEQPSKSPYSGREIRRDFELYSRWVQHLLVIMAMATLYFATLAPVAAQTEAPNNITAPEIHYGRETTSEEAAILGRVYENSTRKCTGEILKLPGAKFSNVMVSSLHCTIDDYIDMLFNPGFIAFDPTTDKSEKKYEAVRLIKLPETEGVPSAAVLVVLGESISLENGVDGAELATEEMLQENQVSIMGYGMDENGNYPLLPKIITQEIIDFGSEKSMYGCRNIPGMIVTKPSKQHTDHGDSGGYMGYIKKNEKGETKFFQAGALFGPCNSSEEERGSFFSSLVAAPVREKITSVMEEASQHPTHQEIPFTSTSPKTLDSLEGLKRVSGDNFDLKNGTSETRVLYLDHNQAVPLSETTVSLVATHTEIVSGGECVSIDIETPPLPLVLENGMNAAVSNTITSNCELEPFELHYSYINQKLDLIKRVADGDIETTVERNIRITTYSALDIDVSLLSDQKTEIYNQNGVIITASLTDTISIIELEIKSTKSMNYLYYELKGLPGSQSSDTADNKLLIEWTPEELALIKSQVPVTRKLSIQIPNPELNGVLLPFIINSPSLEGQSNQLELSLPLVSN